ncbi:MAG: DNA repair protein RadA [Mesoaciditoga sp.]|uniref:DNA repair protein RadA n=1 Tax=Athalassotoga sp. TaxID=2022597 RepID=UPI000CC1D6F8|nr:MAG: DNA repair protein RadA [Mesoaciditoga sp.]PMP78816.1 MAG: DNA repair protein RadA [Mesoaciditoga sp.]HEU24060.1 DNA repair protein RadA [Mesoaciditoga lauensis]
MSPDKSKIVYVCSECGYKSSKWFGKCPNCGAWDSAVRVEEGVQKGTPSLINFESSTSDISIPKRMTTRMKETDRTLGGGVVPGSVILISGGPGIGKSTLAMEYASALTDYGNVYYVSGEESISQILMRVKRLGVENTRLFLSSDVNVDAVLSSIKDKPVAMVFDSIQTLYTSGMSALAGSVPQMRECTMKLIDYAKSNDTAIFIIGHITKSGSIAGPMILEHMVDGVLYLEGEPRSGRRILRSMKNRFGPTDEIAVYDMEENGMIEIPDPSRIFADIDTEDPGSTLSVIVEGSRPLMVNVQALTSVNYKNSAIRITRGFENTRLMIISAIVSSHLGVSLDNRDIYLNILGGLKTSDTAIDLAVAMAIFSSVKKLKFSPKVAFIGELGLDGRVRNVPQMQLRISEAKRMGIENIIVSNDSKYGGNGVKTLKEAILKSFGGNL